MEQRTNELHPNTDKENQREEKLEENKENSEKENHRG